MMVLAFGLTGLSGPLAAMPADPLGGLARARGPVHLAGGDCSAAAQQVVDETNGQLLSAEPTRDGQSCIITVLVQGDGTTRPRRIRVVVPM